MPAIARTPKAFLVYIFFLGLLLRIIFLPNPGFEADISFWKSWGLAIYDHGIVWQAFNTNNNYPTPFAYILFFMTKTYSFFADPHNFYEYWNNNNLLFLTLAKLPSILADFGIAGIILWIGKHAKKIGFPTLPFSFYIMLTGLYLLNPISIIDGAWWGQVDSLGVFFFLLAVVAALTKRPLLAGAIFMGAMMTKLQNMIYGPVFFVFIWQYMGLTGLIRAVTGAALSFFGLNIEFLLSRNMAKVFASLTDNYDYFPLLSLNAYNVWWIVAGANGMKASDKIATLGIINAKTLGLFLFSSTYLLAILVEVEQTFRAMLTGDVNLAATDPKDKSFSPMGSGQAQQKIVIFRFLSALILAAAGFFLFQTQSHDRYAFPISVFLLLWLPFAAYFANPKLNGSFWKDKSLRKYLTGYIFFSLIYFYNLHTAMVANYPYNGLPLLSSLTGPQITITMALIQILIFILFIVSLRRHLSALTIGIPLLTLAGMIAVTNAPLFLKKPVLLTKITPMVSHQSYATRMNNMPANASFGFDKWGYLSDQYYFYKHGLGTHANSYHIFDINRQFKRFTTDYGIDTQAGSRGNGTFEIYGDGKKLFASQKRGRFDLPQHVEVDITGVKMFGLVTTDTGDGVNDDHTDWLNAMFWP